MATIPQSLQAQRPQPTPTVAEQRLIKQYGSLEAAKASQVQDRVNAVIEKINRGEITNPNQIPEDLRAYLDVPSNFFQDKQRQLAFIPWQDTLRALDRQKSGKAFFLGLQPSNQEVRKFENLKQAIDAYKKGKDISKYGVPVDVVKAGVEIDTAKRSFGAKLDTSVRTYTVSPSSSAPQPAQSLQGSQSGQNTIFGGSVVTDAILKSAGVRTPTPVEKFRGETTYSVYSPSSVVSKSVLKGDPFEGQRAVTAAPTVKQQLKQIVETRNPVRILDYAVTRAIGKGAAAEEVTTGSARLLGGKTGERVKSGLIIGAYTNPYTGPALGVATAAGQITPGGQKEAAEFGKQVESKYGVPRTIGTAGLYTATIGGAVLSAPMLVKQADNLFGFPKYETRFLSSQKLNAGVDDTINYLSKDLAITREKRLLYDKYYLSGTKTVSQVKPLEEGKYIFTAATAGKSRQIGAYDLMRRNYIKGKPAKIASAQYGQIEKAELAVPIAQGTRKVLDEGYSIVGVGKTAVPKKLTDNKISEFVFRGASGNIDDTRSFVILQSAPVKNNRAVKIGKGTSLGVVKREAEEEAANFVYGGLRQAIKKPKQIKVIQQEITKQGIEQSIRASSAPVKSSGFRAFPIGGAAVQVRDFSAYSLLTGQSSRQESRQRQSQFFSSANRQGTEQRLDQRQRQTPRITFLSLTSTQPRQEQPSGSAFRLMEASAQISPTTTVSVPSVPSAPNQPRAVPPIITFDLPGEKRSYRKEEAYDVEVYRDATKYNKARWEQINRMPLTQESARSAGARDVDNSISARFRVKKSPDVVKYDKNGKPVGKSRPEPVNTNDKYFQVMSYKFRPYSGKAKKALPTGQYIEKQRYRADSANETGTLRQARSMAALIAGGLRRKA